MSGLKSLNTSAIPLISLAIIGKAKDIYLAGFDGYIDNKELNNQMEIVFKKFNYNGDYEFIYFE